MRTLFHALGFLLSMCLFLLGYFVVDRRVKLARSLAHSPESNERMCKFFFYGGGALEVVASIGGLLEGVAILILTSGMLVDAVVGM